MDLARKLLAATAVSTFDGSGWTFQEILIWPGRFTVLSSAITSFLIKSFMKSSTMLKTSAYRNSPIGALFWNQQKWSELFNKYKWNKDYLDSFYYDLIDFIEFFWFFLRDVTVTKKILWQNSCFAVLGGERLKIELDWRFF